MIYFVTLVFLLLVYYGLFIIKTFFVTERSAFDQLQYETDIVSFLFYAIVLSLIYLTGQFP